MGADLYIEKDKNENTGYFRDSYNPSNILWKLGLSYWKIEDEIPGMGKVNRKLTIKQVHILYEEVIKRKSILDKFLETVDEKWLSENNCQPGIDEWKKGWMKLYDELVTFLKHAIDLRSKIIWSV